MSNGQQTNAIDEAYRKQVEVLETYANEASNGFDRTLITLSSGALAVSIAFINQIAPNPIKTEVCVIAWMLFAASLTSTLTALFCSHKAMRREIKTLRKAAEKRDWTYSESNLWNTCTRILNYISLATFIIGVAFLVTFAAFNASRTESRGSEPTPSEEEIMPENNRKDSSESQEESRTTEKRSSTSNRSGNYEVLKKAQTVPDRPYISQAITQSESQISEANISSQNSSEDSNPGQDQTVDSSQEQTKNESDIV